MAHKETEALVRKLRAMGWEVAEGRHYTAYPPDKSKAPITFAKTPSDRRALKNTISLLRRAGADL
jgi:hypothetical protein